MFSGKVVQYLWALSSCFPGAGSCKNPGESTSSLSSWTNTAAYSIPESLPLCCLSFQAGTLVSFAHACWEMKSTCCTQLHCTVQCGRGGCICSESSGKNTKDVRTDWSQPLPVFGDRKKKLSPFIPKYWCLQVGTLHKTLVVTLIYGLGVLFECFGI